jgi:hypothetical protein
MFDVPIRPMRVAAPVAKSIVYRPRPGWPVTRMAAKAVSVGPSVTMSKPRMSVAFTPSAPTVKSWPVFGDTVPLAVPCVASTSRVVSMS